MLKEKTKFIFIFSLIFVLLCGSFSFVVNAADIHEAETKTEVPNNIKNGDEYLCGQDVTVEDPIDGNLYVIANTVTIKSQIVGDAFILANQLVIEKEGYIYSNLFACAQSITINGNAYDVYACTNNFNISGGYVYRDLHICSSYVNIAGIVGRNASISCDNLSFGTGNSNDVNEISDSNSKGIINGNLEYSAKAEASIPEGSVTGETKFTPVVVNNKVPIMQYVISAISFLCLVIFIWLMLLWLSPKFLNKTSELLKTKKSSIALYGILGIILAPIVSVLLLISSIASNVGLLILALYIVLLCVSKSFFTIAINKLICTKLKIEKNLATFGMLIVSGLIVWSVGLIPYVGSILGFFMIWIGLGILLTYIIPERKKSSKDIVNTDNKNI